MRTNAFIRVCACTWRVIEPSMQSRTVGAAVCENKAVGGPGVGLAHVKRVGGIGAELPGWVQAVKFAPLVDCSGGVGVVVSEALVDVAVVGDGPGRGCCCSLASLFSFALCFSGLWDDTLRHSGVIREEGRQGNDLRPAALLCLALLFGSPHLFRLRKTDRRRLHADYMRGCSATGLFVSGGGILLRLLVGGGLGGGRFLCFKLAVDGLEGLRSHGEANMG